MAILLSSSLCSRHDANCVLQGDFNMHADSYWDIMTWEKGCESYPPPQSALRSRATLGKSGIFFAFQISS